MKNMLDKDKRIIVFNVDISSVPENIQEEVLTDYSKQCQASFDESVKTLIFPTNRHDLPKAEVITDFPLKAKKELKRILSEFSGNTIKDYENIINEIKKIIE